MEQPEVKKEAENVVHLGRKSGLTCAEIIDKAKQRLRDWGQMDSTRLEILIEIMNGQVSETEIHFPDHSKTSNYI